MTDEELPITEGNLDEEEAKRLTKRARTIQQLRNVNSGLAREIESFGHGVELSLPRLEAFIMFLVDEGIITTDQHLDEAERWERLLRPQLIQTRDTVKANAARAQRHREAVQKHDTSKPLTKPGGIILPFGATKSVDPAREERGMEKFKETNSGEEAPQSEG